MIEKDIELVSNLKNIELKGKVNEQYIYAKIPEEYLNAIENVLSELEELREDNYAYHQLMRMQNKREYRSKFLKDFKKEYGENVMPDYDEIYKRYDKQKKEIETKDKAIETWKKIAEKLAEELTKLTEENKEYYLDWAKREVEKNDN